MYLKNISDINFVPGSSYVLRVQGNSRKCDNVIAYLDREEISTLIRRNDGANSNQKEASLDYSDTERFVFDIFLPADFEKAHKLTVFTVSGSHRSKYDSVPVKKIAGMKEKPVYHIDRFDSDSEGTLIIEGWAVYYQAPQISVMNRKREPLPFSIEKVDREDVQQIYSMFSPMKDCGFHITVPGRSLDEVIVAFKADKVTEECMLPISQGRKLITKLSALDEKIFSVLDRSRRVAFRKKVENHLSARKENEEYTAWYLKTRPDDAELERQRKTEFHWKPKFSIVVPLYKTPENFLSALIDSVKAQTYPNWELCFSDGSGSESPLKDFLSSAQQEDSRIRVISHSESLQISENTNAAIGIATGDFVVFADHDDELVPNSLFECVRVLNDHPELEMIYSDEDKINMEGTEYFQPHFKPDFNYDLLCTQNYICHLCVVKKSLLEKAGLLQSEFDGSQDFDFVLRCAENTSPEKIHHIPKILYHWRCHSGSTAVNPQSKMYAFDAGKRAVQAHFDRIGVSAETVHSPFLGLYRTIFSLPSEPFVSAVIVNRGNSADLIRCIESIRGKSSYKNIEYLIMNAGAEDQNLSKYFESIRDSHLRFEVMHCDPSESDSHIRNQAVLHAGGEYILFMDSGNMFVNRNGITELLGCCMRNEIGAVGGRICYEDNTIRHAGIVIGIGGSAGCCFAGEDKHQPGYFGAVFSCQNYSAVSGEGMLVKKQVFDKVGGFDEKYGRIMADIDLCLRISKIGYQITYTPYAEMCFVDNALSAPAHETIMHDISYFKDKWSEMIRQGDPYYNEHLTLEKNDFSLRR